MAERNFLGVFGHTILDYIIELPRFPKPNQSIELLDKKRYFGGTGANVARIASRLGVRTALASFVGEDFPEEYYSVLLKDGVDLTDLRRLKGYTTPTAWIFSDREGNQIAVVDQGPMKDADKFELLEHTVRSSKIVHVGTGRPVYYDRVVSLAKDLRKKVAFDPSQEIHYVYNASRFRSMLERSNYFFANQEELSTALRYLKMKGPKDLLDFVDVFVLTKGRKGSVIYAQGERIEIPYIKAERVVDVTGAGDAYRAGFYVGLSKGTDLEKCGLIGSAVASFIIQGKGTQSSIPNWEDVGKRIEKHLKKR